MDGELGAHVRAAIAKVGLHAFEKIWDNGFRQMTIERQADRARAKDMEGPQDPRAGQPARGSRCSRPSAPAPTSLQFSEVYSALQTKVVDAQENPLPIIQVAKLYEVQKYCSLTNHIWDGFWFIANGRAWEALPDDLQDDRRRSHQRRRPEAARGHRKLNETVQADLRPRGWPSTRPNPTRFRAKLREAGFYAEWKEPLRRRGLGPARSSRRQARLSAMTPQAQTPRSVARRPAAAAAAGTRELGGAGTDRPRLGAGGRDRRGRAGAGRDRACCSPASSPATSSTAPLVWSDELASILFLWLAMLGAVVALRRGEHMRMTALVSRVAPATRALARSAGARGAARLPAAGPAARASSMRRRRASSSPRRWRSATPGAPRRIPVGIGADARWSPCCGCCASPRSALIARGRAGRGRLVAAVLACRAAAGAARQAQPGDLLRRRRRGHRVRRRADRVLLRAGHLRLSRADHARRRCW